MDQCPVRNSATAPQQQPTAIMNYHQQQQNIESSHRSDHVLIKWHDSWLNHVLISQLPWLHELSSISNGLDIWSITPLSVTTSGKMWSQAVWHYYRGHSLLLVTRVLHKNISGLGSARLHHVLHNPHFLCSLQNVRGYVMSWIWFNWNGRVAKIRIHVREARALYWPMRW